MIRSTPWSALALAVMLGGTAAAQNPPPAPKPPAPKPAAQQPAPPAPKPAMVATNKPTVHKVKETAPGLLKQAKIKPEAAEETALAAVPGGTVTSRMITKEKTTLVYVFNIKVKGQEGYNRVTVDATTGALGTNTHKAGMAKTTKPSTSKPPHE